MNVKRIFAEKKPAYAVKAGELREELEHYLGISSVKNMWVLIHYGIGNLSEEIYREALVTIFSEPPVDLVYEGEFTGDPGDLVFSVEYLSGRFDQRTGSAEQCVKLLKEDEEPVIRSTIAYVATALLTAEQEGAIKSFCINPVDSRQADEEKPETLVTEFEVSADILYFDRFADSSEEELKALYDALNLAMTFKDFPHVQNYYKKRERRGPSVTEIRMLDTYQSDHCHHTTFSIEFKNVNFMDGGHRESMEETYKQYLADREVIYRGRDGKYVCLMDLVLMAMKKLRSEGELTDMEVPDEINTCGVVVLVEIGGVTEGWPVNFKNETRNHPTETESLDGATICLDETIRDPLSGRTYVYQTMRVTDTADPIRPLGEALKGKLPQRKIVNGMVQGYSSYGNQVDLATGCMKEIYHPGYVAKRMEIGIAMGAAPGKDAVREASDPGDTIILLGGHTNRDGIGGATGSSEVHTTSSIEVCGAEVQKGNAPTGREVQRTFHRPEVSRIIKKCNDLGTNGISVAIGELTAGLKIDLGEVPKRYAGLDGTEIAISKFQERTAAVADPKNVDQFLAYASEENLETVIVAAVTKESRPKMDRHGKIVVDLNRTLLDTNGVHQETDVTLEVSNRAGDLFDKAGAADIKGEWLGIFSDLNICSQKGLVECFDGSIGVGSVFMPYGGKYQLIGTQATMAKLPMLKGYTGTVTMMSYGFDPRLSSWNLYHGMAYAVVSSVVEIVATGGDYSGIRPAFQEYFRRVNENPSKWSQSSPILLDTYSTQLGFGLPSIGGKDSMSGTSDTEDGKINIPSALASFAVDVNSYKNVTAPEFKRSDSRIILFRIVKSQYDLPNYSQVIGGYGKIFEDIKARRTISAYAVEGNGLAEAMSKIAFGNKLGVKIEHNVDPGDLFAAAWGDTVCEVSEVMVGQLSISYTVIGKVTDRGAFEYGNISITTDEALNVWVVLLENMSPTAVGKEAKGEETALEEKLHYSDAVYVCDHRIGRPTVFIPVSPGINCEYDDARAFERADARVVTRVLRSMNAEDIRQSVEECRKEIAKAQIVMFPGGLSVGDEPEGSVKLLATVFRNAAMKEGIEKPLGERDGLMLGTCNDFQTLIKLGILSEGEVREQGARSPTPAMNTIDRHVSKMVHTKMISDESPWLAGAGLGSIYCNPASHGGDRPVANESWLCRPLVNGQVVIQHMDDQNRCIMDEYWNSNGFYMAIEGITSPDEQILGKMAHSGRRDEAVAMNIYKEQDMRIFESGTRYFEMQM